MIPLRDNVPTRTLPVVNLALIGANVWAFLFELSLGRDLQGLLLGRGLVPLRYAVPGALERFGLEGLAAPPFTAMFLHGGWAHLLTNMWMLWIFGDNVEDRLGHGRYLVFYLLAGLAGSAAHVWSAWGSPVPVIGASGAIAGVLGAYFVLYPRARVVCLVPVFVFLTTAELPAVVFLGLWLWSQLHSGALALAGTAGLGGVAWWAHIGGFAAGILLLPFLLRRRRA